ncbi:LTA synthase family protein [Fluviibacter phosphoraccumulans]|uniref:Capsular polysaccharide biosynthesis protein n=1 Tax=Fluviibacter phosphoraccumulans TaxID=1751046 RepID=A0A7R6TQN1_9RHOO|nr:LTA synthase family protein [Fluviibacter phosphoraccumulans]BBU69608.1 capsular polysaccharide biosynthesis protein [Fluviibacter phosphoraccumulans]BBU71209.1 capsular polysaccharide biosynthesis protein [Fluviibacter phosphoraccumulans]
MSLLLAVLVGLGLSVVTEQFLAPRPPGYDRAKGAWALHIGLWFLGFTGGVVLVQRPWFAMLLVSAFLLLIVVISNAKFKSLAEPFTVQDFRYLKDAIRYPRLYLPFLGWGKALIAILGVLLAVVIGFLVEPAFAGGVLGIPAAIVGLLLGSVFLLWLGNHQLPEPGFEPIDDLARLGLLASLWAYARALRNLPSVTDQLAIDADIGLLAHRPHLVAVQSESFFDPRGLLPAIKSEVLAAFDAAKDKGRAFGMLSVPALGANTVRSEFGFLTGVDDSSLGAHKFNPYESVLKGWQVETLPKLLKRLGYRTVCIHPYVAGFYSRDRVFPLLGIDEFIDVSAFDGAERAGHYVSDAAVTYKVLEVLTAAQEPTFVFVITMENHGPLHLEHVSTDVLDALYDSAPPKGFDDLSAYLRHLKNADGMVSRLTSAFDQMTTPVSMCWYGDHVPIMPDVYDRLQDWPRDSDYLIWDNCNFPNSKRDAQTKRMPLAIHQLAGAWLSR